METILSLKNINKSYKKNKLIKDILVDCSFDINKGEIIGIVGPNGAGKTTILKIISGLIIPNSGSVEYENSTKRPKIELLMEGSRSFYWNLTGRQNLEYFSVLFNVKNHKKRINDLVNLLDMDNFIDSISGDYSRGMQQKLSVALSLLDHPNILLLDEPTNGLDEETIDKLVKILKDLNKVENLTVLTVSHDTNFINRISDEILLVKDGNVKKINKSETAKYNIQPISIIFENYGDDISKSLLFENVEYENEGNKLIVKGDLFDMNFFRFIQEIDNNKIGIKEVILDK